jgi:lysozyme
MMKTTDILLLKLMEMEGLKLEAYLDAAGVPTIGYGHTKGVRMGDRITRWWAIEQLKDDVAEVERQVEALGVARTEGQMDALVSFAFNLGIARLEQSTLLKLIREGGSRNAIKREFKRWVYADGKKLRGLERRREWEAKRFFE